MIREITINDMLELQDLYQQLHPDQSINKEKFFAQMKGLLQKEYIKLIGLERENKIIATCLVARIDGLSYDCRPFAVVENLVTDLAHRKEGCATKVVGKAVAIAKDWNCYKIILETGTKAEWKLQFYENCGFSRNEKTSFIKRFS